MASSLRINTKVEKRWELLGSTFVVTGTRAGYSRVEATEAIQALGGKVAGSVSANTNCVVIGTDPGSKADMAKQWGVKTLSETAFPDWKVVKKDSI